MFVFFLRGNNLKPLTDGNWILYIIHYMIYGSKSSEIYADVNMLKINILG